MSLTDGLERLHELHERGALGDEEFAPPNGGRMETMPGESSSR